MHKHRACNRLCHREWCSAVAVVSAEVAKTVLACMAKAMIMRRIPFIFYINIMSVLTAEG